MNNFSELSGSVFSWLEERCKPQLLQEAMYDALNEVKDSYEQLEQQPRQQQQLHLNPQDLLNQMKTENK